MVFLLHKAALAGDLKAVQRLLQQPGASVNQTDENGAVPLHCAALKGHIDVIDALVAAGAAVNAQTQTDLTPLLYAIANTQLAAVECLLRHGANLNTTPAGEIYPLLMAVKERSPEIARVLLNAGADPNYQNEGLTPFLAAICLSQYDIIAACIDAGANLGPIGSGEAPLSFAIHQQDNRSVRMLLDAGADVNLKSYLHECIECLAYSETPSIDVLHTVLSAGADVLQTDDLGRTALQYHSQGIIVFANRDRLDLFDEAIVALVAAGDRNWACVPPPCYGLERALPAVWGAEPNDTGKLYSRLAPAVQAKFRAAALTLRRFNLPMEVAMPIIAQALH